MILTQFTDGQAVQTSWFYERTRGQYKNARIREGSTAKKQVAFDLRNPRAQVFTKEDMAKYLNVSAEVYDGKKLVTGPHFVVRGGQKNYVQLMHYIIPSVREIDNIYFEDLIARAILFKRAEKIYGVKPNAIGDLRYVTVPYSIALLFQVTQSKIDLYKIWRNQEISSSLQSVLYALMVQAEIFIKENAPGSLYGEWAKKEECWTAVKNHSFTIDVAAIQTDLQNPGNSGQRRRVSKEEVHDFKGAGDMEKIKAVPGATWYKIEDWGRATGAITVQQQNTAWILAGKLKNGGNPSEYEILAGLKILDVVIKNAPEILFEIEDSVAETTDNGVITLELIRRMTEWDSENKRLKPQYFQYMVNIVDGKTALTKQAKGIVMLNLGVLEKHGFR
jgi:hypothetical protein